MIFSERASSTADPNSAVPRQSTDASKVVWGMRRVFIAGKVAQVTEGRGEAEGRRQKAEGRRQKAEGRRQRARQKAEGQAYRPRTRWVNASLHRCRNVTRSKVE